MAIIQILERGESYLIFTLRGLESQDMTSCHNVEACSLNLIIEDSNNCLNTNYFSSLQPKFSSLVETYEENEIKLTGIIE